MIIIFRMKYWDQLNYFHVVLCFMTFHTDVDVLSGGGINRYRKKQIFFILFNFKP